VVVERAMVGSYVTGGQMLAGQGYRPQLILQIVAESDEPISAKAVMEQTTCTDKRIIASLMHRLFVSGYVNRSGTPRSKRGNKPQVGVYRYVISNTGAQWLKKFGDSVGTVARQESQT